MKKSVLPALCYLSFLLLTGLMSGCGGGGGGGNNDNNVLVVPINVTSIHLQGTYSLNGGAFPVSQYEDGLISLADNDNNKASLGDTYNGGYDTYVVTGTYNTKYTNSQGGNIVPSNKDNDIATGILLQSDQVLDIDVVAHSVRFVFTLDGVSFPVSEYDDALFYLQRTDGGERILLGNSHTTIDPVWIMPGTYNVIYEVETPGTLVPINENAIVATVVIDALTSGVNIDITTTDFRFGATLDGVAFPVSQYEDGDFYLRNSAGDHAVLGNTYDLPFIVNVIEGTYNIVYAHETGTSVPLNSQAIVVSNQLINAANSNLNLNIQTSIITPQMTLNGNPFPVSEYEDGNIFLRGTTNNDDLFLISNTHLSGAPPNVKVINGNYDVIYQHETGIQVPQNTNAVISGNVAINADAVLPVAVSSVDITGIFTLNGSNFTVSQFQVAEFYLKGTEPEDDFLLGYSFQGNGTARLIPGTYDVIYRHTDGNNIPRNPEKTIMTGLLLDTSKSIRINVAGTVFRPVFNMNNVAFTGDYNEVASFYVHGETSTDRIYIGRSYIQQNANVYVINGNYDVIYEYFKGSSIPINERALITNIDIP